MEGLIFICLSVLSFLSTSLAISCVQCQDKDITAVGVNASDCLHTPPPSKPCKKDMTSCLIITTYDPSSEVSETPSSIIRSCSSYDHGFDCQGNHPRDTGPETCFETCFTDGCNASSSWGFHPYLGVCSFILLELLCTHL